MLPACFWLLLPWLLLPWLLLLRLTLGFGSGSAALKHCLTSAQALLWQGLVGGKAAAADASTTAAVQSKVDDNGDGSYKLSWACQRAGTYPIEVLISGLHVKGSPMRLTVQPAAPAIERCVARSHNAP